MRGGVIGTVGHLNYVLNGIPVLDGVELVAAAAGTPDEDLGRIRAHNAFSDETIFYDDWVTMLDKADLEIVAVCRPYPMNAEATIAALERNIHVVTEKPVATTFDTLNKVEEARAGSSARLTTMFGMRFEPAFRAARKAVEDGRIGEPVLATGQKSYKFGNRPEFFRNRDTYGGSILWVGIHAVDFVRWVSGLTTLWLPHCTETLHIRTTRAAKITEESSTASRTAVLPSSISTTSARKGPPPTVTTACGLPVPRVSLKSSMRVAVRFYFAVEPPRISRSRSPLIYSWISSATSGAAPPT